METLQVVFERHAREVFKQYPDIQVSWDAPKKHKKRLTIFKQDETGFDVAVEAEPWGLYPVAGDWHGMPWEAGPGGTWQELCDAFMKFLLALLCPDAALEVTYAGSRAHRWKLRWPPEYGFEDESTGLLVFNYFAPKTTRVFQNNHLPSRFQ